MTLPTDLGSQRDPIAIRIGQPIQFQRWPRPRGLRPIEWTDATIRELRRNSRGDLLYLISYSIEGCSTTFLVERFDFQVQRQATPAPQALPGAKRRLHLSDRARIARRSEIRAALAKLTPEEILRVLDAAIGAKGSVQAGATGAASTQR